LYRLVLFAVAATLAVVACTQTDLNQPCALVKSAPNPDGGVPIAVPILKTDDVIRNSANKDFISFGSPDCEDQVCVRDSAFREDAGDTTNVAHGYCSTYCAEGSSGTCQSFSSAFDQNPTTKLTCRPLLLDSATLQAIKTADAGYYSMIFGMTTSPYFCARSGTFGDAGP
jgi:hypothetical protein